MYSFIHPPFITCFILFIHFIIFFLFHLSTPSYFIFIQLRTTDQQVPFFFHGPFISFFLVYSFVHGPFISCFSLFIHSRSILQLFSFRSFTVHLSVCFVSQSIQQLFLSWSSIFFIYSFFVHLSIDLEYSLSVYYLLKVITSSTDHFSAFFIIFTFIHSFNFVRKFSFHFVIFYLLAIPRSWSKLYPGLIYSILDPGLIYPILDPGLNYPILDPGLIYPILHPGLIYPILDPGVIYPILDPGLIYPILDPTLIYHILDLGLIYPILDPTLNLSYPRSWSNLSYPRSYSNLSYSRSWSNLSYPRSWSNLSYPTSWSNNPRSYSNLSYPRSWSNLFYPRSYCLKQEGMKLRFLMCLLQLPTYSLVGWTGNIKLNHNQVKEFTYCLKGSICEK